MTDTELVPGVGSQVSRYSLLREIGRGPLGPLYACLKDGNDDAAEMLARVVPMSNSIQEEASKELADAAWDSAIVSHALSLRVADVHFGGGWLTVVHDGAEGMLLTTLEAKCFALSAPMPPEVAIRIVLDVLEGLELSREQCAAVKLKWWPGTVSPHSLYLCRDGRTRSLDGQVLSALLRVGEAGALASWGPLPPELSQLNASGDERSDVFLVGALLWRLLVGRDFDPSTDYQNRVADLAAALPAARTVSPGVAQVQRRALAWEPDGRHGSLRELSVALVMGVEKVATYVEVASYVDAVRLLETSGAAPARVAAVLPEPMVDETTSLTANEASLVEGAAEALPPTTTCDVDAGVLAASMPSVEIGAVDSASTAVASSSAVVGEQSNLHRLSQISWADDGQSAGSGATAREAPLASGAPSTSGDSEQVISLAPKASKPLVTRAALTSNRPPRHERSPEPSDAVKEVLTALEKKAVAKTPPAAEPEKVAEPAPPRRLIQINLGTLVFGFLTTVLAVVVVMLLVMRQGPKKEEGTRETSAASRVSGIPENPHATVDGAASSAAPSAPAQALMAPVIPATSAGSFASPSQVSVPLRGATKSARNARATSSGSRVESTEENTAKSKPSGNYVPSEL